MARRGDVLREHILLSAKDVFLEMGFERASMDEVANRAKTSKRSLYAHFESKENLFLAVIEMVRGLFLNRIGTPSDYSDTPAEALELFCACYVEVLLYEGSIRMLRVSASEAERFPEQATQYFDVLFTQIHARLSAYLEAVFSMTKSAGAAAAHRLLGTVLYPRFQRALFGIDPLAKKIDANIPTPGFDREPIREAVVDLIHSLKEEGRESSR